ncbi:MAG: nucleotidyltransferase domain-containing protein [Selenomonadaceae bacterium]|nr:nucleotidyltransferase domain-containing protein [Selenomonadaceae bacterium]MBR0284474.1 nucleotidyltransferase domain-containing protein [Selenomonadaceae bacterium]
MPENEIERIKKRLIRRLSPLKIYLFGSFAVGNANEDSDFDFYIVVKDGTGNLVDLTADAYKSIRNVRSRAVDIIIGTESRFESRKNKLGLEHEVMTKGVLLYG